MMADRKQIYRPILDNEHTASSMNLVSLSDSSDGLCILIKCGLDKIISIKTNSHVSFRWRDESDALLSINEIQEQQILGCLLYEVINSKFIEWLRDESFNIRYRDELRHYMICTENDIIDIASYEPLDIKDKRSL